MKHIAERFRDWVRGGGRWAAPSDMKWDAIYESLSKIKKPMRLFLANGIQPDEVLWVADQLTDPITAWGLVNALNHFASGTKNCAGVAGDDGQCATFEDTGANVNILTFEMLPDPEGRA